MPREFAPEDFSDFILLIFALPLDYVVKVDAELSHSTEGEPPLSLLAPENTSIHAFGATLNFCGRR